MNRRVLEVLINGELVGTLVNENNAWGFQYVSGWLLKPQAYPLSPSLPLRTDFLLDGSTDRPVQWFFDNLLPEEKLREVIGKEEGVQPADAFGLLERLGAESAGALVLQPPGAIKAAKGEVKLTYEMLSNRIGRLPVASLNKDAPKRMSLAGAQHKMVVCFDASTGRITEPLKGSPSTHILKPNSTAEGYPHSVVNETFTMRLADRLGLRVPQVWRLYVPEPVYIIQRFDRTPGIENQDPRRVHMLDGCQMLNESAIYKYSSANFQKLRELIDLCLNRAVARLNIFRWILFNTLVGNSDSHLKNISFLIDSEGVRVAPFYDLLCTAVYHTRAMNDEQAIWPHEPLAMPVAKATRFGDVTQSKLVETGIELGLSRSTVTREINAMTKRFVSTADDLIAAMTAEYDSLPASQHISPETRAGELHLLRAIRHVVIGDMHTLAGRLDH